MHHAINLISEITVICANHHFTYFFYLKEKSVDSCSTPIPKNETLPAGCAVNSTNATTVDVGECEAVTCVRGNSTFNSSCTDHPLCCGPRSHEKVLVQCGAIVSFDLSIVKSCGCGKCIEKETVIEGIAVGQDDRAAKSVDVFFAGKSVDTTDENGKFSFVVPKDTRRAIVTFKDQTNKKFQEEDKTFIVNEGQTVQYRVILKEKPKPITFNASEPLLVPLGGESDSFADLELPENALLTEDGSVFSGNAKASVSVTDPRNQSDVSSAPGDFSTTSEDGEEEMLETYGMMKLNLEDENGKPLSMSKPMKVYLDTEKLNISISKGNVSVKLYWLDRKTGRWREAGDLFPEDGSKRRRKRSNRIFLTATVDPSIGKHDLNLDTPTRRIGLRVSTDSSMKNALIRIICKEVNGQGVGYVEKNTEGGVKCMAIWRDRLCNVLAIDNSNMKFYDPDPESLIDSIKNNIKGNIEPVKKNVGSGTTISAFTFLSKYPVIPVTRPFPLYEVDTADKKICEESHNTKAAKGSQFVFTSAKGENGLKKRYSMLSNDGGDWSSPDGSNNCFIKIETKGKDGVFMAISYKISYEKDKTGYGAGKEYGLHVRESRQNYVCLQFRCPGQDDVSNKGKDTTILLLMPVTTQTAVSCKSPTMDGSLSGIQSIPPCMGFKGFVPDVAHINGLWLCISYNLLPNSLIYNSVDKCEGRGLSNGWLWNYVSYTCTG